MHHDFMTRETLVSGNVVRHVQQILGAFFDVYQCFFPSISRSEFCTTVAAHFLGEPCNIRSI